MTGNKKIIVSIIIVHYNAHAEIFACLDSIEKLAFKDYEVIIVDNDLQNPLSKSQLEKYPWIHYYKNSSNTGYGGGNNYGVGKSRGKYLFFLNPDTRVNTKTLTHLVEFLNNNPMCGIVAPLLFHPNKKPYAVLGSMELTPFAAIVCFSFINKYFPNNPISRKYFLKYWNRKDPISVWAVPGSACMVRKTVFNMVGGFDEQMFLYFEEHDLGKRVISNGYTVNFCPQSTVIHVGGAGTKNIDTANYFTASRYRYFKKHFGSLPARLVELFLIQ